MYISIFSSLVRICIIAKNWNKRASDKGRLRLVKLVRPIMVVLIMGGMIARERRANELFRRYSIELGQHIQEICDLEGKCPKTIEGWDIIQDNPGFCQSGSFVTKVGRKASVRYESMTGANEFEIIVNYGNLARYHFQGGVKRNLKAKRNGQSIDIESEEIYDEEEEKLKKEAMDKIREYQERENG
jgi:hypothetical protein